MDSRKTLILWSLALNLLITRSSFVTLVNKTRPRKNSLLSSYILHPLVHAHNAGLVQTETLIVADSDSSMQDLRCLCCTFLGRANVESWDVPKDKRRRHLSRLCIAHIQKWSGRREDGRIVKTQSSQVNQKWGFYMVHSLIQAAFSTFLPEWATKWSVP